MWIYSSKIAKNLIINIYKGEGDIFSVLLPYIYTKCISTYNKNNLVLLTEECE